MEPNDALNAENIAQIYVFGYPAKLVIEVDDGTEIGVKNFIERDDTGHLQLNARAVAIAINDHLEQHSAI